MVNNFFSFLLLCLYPLSFTPISNANKDGLKSIGFGPKPRVNKIKFNKSFSLVAKTVCRCTHKIQSFLNTVYRCRYQSKEKITNFEQPRWVRFFFQNEKLDESNYASWSVQMKSVLIHSDLWGVVCGRKVKSEEFTWLQKIFMQS